MLLVGGGLVLYYLLVLRRYNSLGFRLFSLMTMVTVMLAWLIRQDEKRLSSLATHGQRVIATIVSKEKVKGGAPNAVTVSWKDAAGSEVVKQTSQYVSDPEWEAFAVKAPWRSSMMRQPRKHTWCNRWSVSVETNGCSMQVLACFS